jgi:long-chain acyl-CoA synthetase
MEETTLVAIFQNRVKRYGSRAALSAKKEGEYRDISWREFGETVRWFSLGLVSLGVEKGDRVALLSENRPEWAYADMAILHAAAVDVPIYSTNTPRQCHYIIANSSAKVVIASTMEQLRKILEVREELPDLSHIVAMDPLPEELTQSGVLPLDEVLELGKKKAGEAPGFFEERWKSVLDEDLASILYTSGTTGDPKGVMLTHRNFVSNARAISDSYPLSEDDVLLSFLPLSHSFERTAGFHVPLYIGARIAYAESIEKVAQNMQEVRPTLMCSVPRLYEKMYARVLDSVAAGGTLKKKLFQWAIRVGKQYNELKREGKPLPGYLRLKRSIADSLVFSKLKEKTGGRLRFFVSGGAPLAKEIGEFFYNAGIVILEAYGLTETSPGITGNRLEKFKFGTVGPALPGIEIKIAGDGEILCRGPNIMKGYYGMPEATKETIDPDGWLHTGDIGELDEDGYLRITDRKKDIIVTAGGKNVAPQNLENLFKTDRYISEFVVIGDKKPYLTALIVPDFENVKAWAEAQGLEYTILPNFLKKPEVKALYRERIDALSGNLARYETIKKFTLLATIFSQETGELTPTLKVKRKVVSRKYADLIEAMYES